MEAKKEIIVKEVINDNKAITIEQGEMLFDRINELYQKILELKIRSREVIEISFEGIEEVSMDFLLKSFSNFRPEEIINYFIIKDIETMEIIKLIKLNLSNMIMLLDT